MEKIYRSHKERGYMKYIYGICSISVVIAMCYYLIVLPNQKENIKKENQVKLLNCLSSVDTNYNTDWNRDCSLLGRSNGCGLEKAKATYRNDLRESGRAECLKIFSN